MFLLPPKNGTPMLPIETLEVQKGKLSNWTAKGPKKQSAQTEVLWDPFKDTSQAASDHRCPF